jgi:predicted ATP-grasp superfamily ATP-dependent carboligase
MGDHRSEPRRQNVALRQEGGTVARGGGSGQVDFLLRLARRYQLNGWTIFPTSDEAAGFLARHAAELEETFRRTVPPWDRLRWAYDKRLSHQIAIAAGVDDPRTYYPSSRVDVTELVCDFWC